MSGEAIRKDWVSIFIDVCICMGGCSAPITSRVPLLVECDQAR